MATVNRRDFLKAVGIGSTAAASGCYSYDPKVPQEYVLPYVANPEDQVPGTATYYATVCNGCANACGAIARAKDGRVVFVEGNPDHPQGPGLCTRGHFGLVAAYSPDRLAGPLDGGKETTWDAAQKAVVDAVTAAKAAGKGVAWLGHYRTGSMARLLDELSGSVALRRVHWEPLGVETLLAASRTTFGVDHLPTYVLDEAHTILSFGMDFLGTAFDSMAMTKGWSKAKDPAQGKFVTRYVAVEPRVGVTSSQADNWLAPTPGTELKVAMAVAKLAKAKTGYAKPAGAAVDAVDVAAVAKESGISEEKLNQVVGWLTDGPSVVLPGGTANAGVDASALASVTLLLNDILGNIGKSVRFGRGARPGAVSTYEDVKTLLADCKAGKIGVLFLDGANPVYELPAELDAAGSLAAVDRVIQFADETNDSTIQKALLLPPASSLENWGDAEVHAGVYGLQQPAMTPLKDNKAVGDVLLGLAKAFPGGAAAPAAPAAPADPAAPAAPAAPASATAPISAQVDTWAAYVKKRWELVVYPLSGAVVPFEQFWRDSLQLGGFFQEAPIAAPEILALTAPTPAETPKGDGMALVVFPSPLLGDGRHANVPWAQEIADPITSYFWNTWAELNPKTVERLGLGESDMVEIKAGGKSVKVGFFASPGVREDVVAIIGGNGHSKDMGRYATNRGVNPISLLGDAMDAGSRAFAGYGARATVTRTEGKSTLFALVGSMTQDGRPVANVCDAKEAVEKLEGEPASILHLHEVPVDKRLEEAGELDMFPEPQHPTYRFALSIDTNVCNGCMACVAACALENNTPFVGPDQLTKGRTMSWIRMDRFWEGDGENQDVRFLPAICQHCAHAPCEGVCPVLATYHNLDGLNAMIYNRCVGTRYCANNCPYTARRFNYHTFQWPESYHLMLNPDLSTREMGVMEKCTFCVQRLRAEKDTWRDVKQTVPDKALQRLTACAAACPSSALTFGNWKDTEGEVRKKGSSPRAYILFGELNTKPGVRYLARVKHDYHAKTHGGGHEGGEHEGGEHGTEKGATEPGAAQHKEG